VYLLDDADVSEELTVSIFRVENGPRDKNGMVVGQSGSGNGRVRIRQSINVVIIGVIYLVRPNTFSIYLVRPNTFSIPSPITYFRNFIHLYFLGFPRLVLCYPLRFLVCFVYQFHHPTKDGPWHRHYFLLSHRDMSHGVYLSPNHSHYWFFLSLVFTAFVNCTVGHALPYTIH
jgi:hypothetical protein